MKYGLPQMIVNLKKRTIMFIGTTVYILLIIIRTIYSVIPTRNIRLTSNQITITISHINFENKVKPVLKARERSEGE